MKDYFSWLNKPVETLVILAFMFVAIVWVYPPKFEGWVHLEWLILLFFMLRGFYIINKKIDGLCEKEKISHSDKDLKQPSKEKLKKSEKVDTGNRIHRKS